jgi:hypothetical protein
VTRLSAPIGFRGSVVVRPVGVHRAEHHQVLQHDLGRQGRQQTRTYAPPRPRLRPPNRAPISPITASNRDTQPGKIHHSANITVRPVQHPRTRRNGRCSIRRVYGAAGLEVVTAAVFTHRVNRASLERRRKGVPARSSPMRRDPRAPRILDQACCRRLRPRAVRARWRVGWISIWCSGPRPVAMP